MTGPTPQQYRGIALSAERAGDIDGARRAMSEAVAALQQLGYKPVEAARMARDAATAGDDSAAIIRKALQSALR